MRRFGLGASLVSALILAGCVGSTAAPSADVTPSGAVSPSGAAASLPSAAPPSALASVTPSAEPSSGAASPLPATPSSSPGPSSSFAVGALVHTVTDGLRVRSLPGTGSDSIKYQPVLPLGTHLTVLAGPVKASGYAWYRVELATPNQTLVDRVREGWVASADHDGTPWIDRGPGANPQPLIEGWPSVRRGTVVMTGRDLRVDPVLGNAYVGAEITGLLPRTQIDLLITERSTVDWACSDGKRGGRVSPTDHPATTTSLRETYSSTGSTLSGKASWLDFTVSPTLPSGCSGDYPIAVTTGGRWDVTITDLENGLTLTPPPYVWSR